jgi:hypothetical protein
MKNFGMGKEIFKSKYFKALYDNYTKIYTSVYLSETENMTDYEWQTLMKDVKNIIVNYKPLYIIDDNRNRLYSYSPDMQNWTLNLFIDSWNSIGLKKYAQIKPRGIIEKLSTRQIEELAVNKFNMKYAYKIVEDYEGAIKWIKE